MHQGNTVPRLITRTFSAPIPRLLRGVRRRKLGPPVPWPVLSLLGFGLLILAGTIILALPISSESGGRTPVVDAAFTAISAVTVTGLVVVDTADYWNKVGEVTILALIQLGGLGLMTATTFLLVLVGFRIGLRGRALARDDLGALGLANVRRFVLSIVAFALLVEGAGFALMYLHFHDGNTMERAAWLSAFHAISAFNNAGFDLLGGLRGFVQFSNNYYVLLVTSGLVILGGLSFAVVANVISVRGLKLLSLNTKIVLAGTLVLLLGGTAFILGAEHGNRETMGAMPWGEKVVNSFFQSVTARTAGFNTLPIPKLHDSTLFFVVLLMFVGAASGSTGGGIKVNTFTVMLSAVIASIRGRKGNELFGRRIPDEQLRKALTLTFVAMVVFSVVTMVIITTEDRMNFLHGLFLVVSSYATVGLSPVDTAILSDAGKVLSMSVMFVGKLGTPLLAMLLMRLDRQTLLDYPEERVNLA